MTTTPALNDDLVRRLRSMTGLKNVHEAADALEAQSKEIEALRSALDEPTDEMLEAGEEEITQRRQFGARIYAADIWNVMARTALKGA